MIMSAKQELHPSPERLVTRRKERFERMVRPADELYDYFRLSLKIMERIAHSLAESGDEPGNPLYQSVQEHELTRLAVFYDQ